MIIFAWWFRKSSEFNVEKVEENTGTLDYCELLSSCGLLQVRGSYCNGKSGYHPIVRLRRCLVTGG